MKVILRKIRNKSKKKKLIKISENTDKIEINKNDKKLRPQISSVLYYNIIN